MPAKPTATYDAAPPDSPARTHAYLVVFENEESRTIDLKSGWTASVGRSRSCGVRIDDAVVSRKHATLRWDGGDTLLLTDHGSHNGTYVDGERISGSVVIRSGAEITLGRARVVVVVRPARDTRTSDTFPSDLVAFDPAMVRAVEIADRAAATTSTVLITGETGAGKELIARRIHAKGARAARPFVAINCSAIPRELAEATLFGCVKGAFTGAHVGRAGTFEAAAGGTLFLDEVGELDLTVQAKLLRALETRSVVRVGATDPISVDVRFVAATNRDLASLVRTGRFREDLWYRLDVLRVDIPPLRERPGDLIPLAQRFLEAAARGRSLRFAPDAQARLRGHSWPGNVRELRNAVERAAALASDDIIRAADLDSVPAEPRGALASALTRRVEDVERDSIVAALEASGGNQSEAARRLGISRRKLIYKLEKYGLKASPRN